MNSKPIVAAERPATPLQHVTPSPLAPRALYQEVADRLRQQIYSRALEPGSWIDEMKLSQEFGISRTPLREALKVLAVEGLVTMKLRRGAYVTEVSRDDLAAGLPPARAAGERRRRRRWPSTPTPRSAHDLQQLHARLERPGAPARRLLRRPTNTSTCALLEIAGNRWAMQIVTDLRKVMKLNRHHSLFKQGRLSDSLAEHRALMDAIAAHDPITCARTDARPFRARPGSRRALTDAMRCWLRLA